MDVARSLRPDRRLVFPFLVVCFPMIWFVFRDAGVRVVEGQRVMTPFSRTLALAIAAIVASYAVSVVVVSAIGPPDGSTTPWHRVLFRPTDGTLLVLVVLWSTIVAYVALSSTANLPFWSELVVGIPLLWPLLLAILVTFAVGNAAPALQAFWVQAAFAVVGLALSAGWTFVLSTGIARVLPVE